MLSLLVTGWVGVPGPSGSGRPIAQTAGGAPPEHLVRAAALPPGGALTLLLSFQNSLAKPTGSYQQRVDFNSSAYSLFLNANWSNAEFYYPGNGTPVPAWIEWNATNTSTDTLIWLGLASITAGGWENVSLIIYAESEHRLSASGPIGEAPELSAQYGALDDGAKVFNFYDGFSVSALGSIWTGERGWTYQAGHGFVFSKVPGSGQAITSLSKFGFPAVLDFYGNLYQSNPATVYLGQGFGTNGDLRDGNSTGLGWWAQSTLNGPAPFASNGTASTTLNSVFSTQRYAVFTSTAVSHIDAVATWNYSHGQSLTTNLPPFPLPIMLAGSAAPSGSSTDTETTLWIRERSYVPTMPKFGIEIEPTFSAQFTETGLPVGTGWWVVVAGQRSATSTNSTLDLVEYNGSYNYSVGSADQRYASPGGTLSVDNGSVTIRITFAPVVFPVRFQTVGLPSTIVWSLTVSGQAPHSVIGSTISFDEMNGSYTYSALSTNTTYSTPGGRFAVTGGAATVSIPFSLVQFDVFFQESGLPAAAAWSVVIDGGPAARAAGENLTVQATNGTHSFQFLTNDPTYAAPGGTFTVAGQPLFEAVPFAPYTYPVHVTASGLPTGTGWWLNVTGQPARYSTLDSETLEEWNGSFSFVASRPNGTYELPSGTFVVNGSSTSVTVEFLRVDTSAIFTEAGLPEGTIWAVTLNGLRQSGTGNIEFTGLINGSYSFTVAAVGSYSPSPASGSIRVQDQPVAESVGFSRPSATTLLLLPPMEVYALIAGLAILAAIIVAVVLGLRRRPPRPDPARPPSGRAAPRPPRAPGRPPGRSPPTRTSDDP